MTQLLDPTVSPSVDLNPSRRPVAIDLFAGAGGLSLGFEQAGFDVVASVEYDPVHCAAHAYNFPNTEILCRDVASLSATELRAAAYRGFVAHNGPIPWDGDVDVMIGGPPCQGFSLIGHRLIDDNRNRLVYEFYRLAVALRPKYVVMENVPGMATGGHSSILHELVREFEEAGYHVEMPVRILNAADYGVPQDRRRLFLLASREGLEPAGYPQPRVVPVPRSGTGAIPPSALPSGPSVGDAILDLPDADAFEELFTSDEVELDIGTLELMKRSAAPFARVLHGDEPDGDDYSRPRRWDPGRLTSSMRTVHTPMSVNRFTATEPGKVEPTSRFYRLPANGLSNTLRAGTGSERGAYTSPRPIHPAFPRVITVREAARLHSFPDWFRFHRTKWHGFRQIGNAVPPLLGRAVGGEVRGALGLSAHKLSKTMELGDPSLLRLDMRSAAAAFEADRAEMPATRKRIAAAG